jgi:hypothetical protein
VVANLGRGSISVPGSFFGIGGEGGKAPFFLEKGKGKKKHHLPGWAVFPRGNRSEALLGKGTGASSQVMSASVFLTLKYLDTWFHVGIHLFRNALLICVISG